MKTKIDHADSFRPVTLTITLESKKELDAMCALFNYAPITDAAEKAGLPDLHGEICERLVKAGGEHSGTEWGIIKDHIKAKA